jgi:hypothetical protein
MSMAFPVRVVPGRASLSFAAAALSLCAALSAPNLPAESLPAKPSLPPTFTIPVETLGYTPPGEYYLGQRFSTVSLDFLGEDRILFTFRVPGLLHRDATNTDQHQIRALVLAIPSGAILSDALWTLHDRNRYLWVLPSGHFLLRDRNAVSEGDATLQTKPLFEFPGPLLWLDPDPSGQFLAASSREPDTAAKSSSSRDAAHADADSAIGPRDYVVRIIRHDTGRVLLVSRSRTVVHLPVNPEGYLEALQGAGNSWLLALNSFSGGRRAVGLLDSDCPPTLDFLSATVAYASGCDTSGRGIYAAFSTSGPRLWLARSDAADVWPLLVSSTGGLRLARETLAINQAVNAYSPIDPDNIKGQLVRVVDTATGKQVLLAPVTPALDAGGNVALSPSGRRVAILTSGVIQVFDLPAPPAVTPSKP